MGRWFIKRLIIQKDQGTSRCLWSISLIESSSSCHANSNIFTTFFPSDWRNGCLHYLRGLTAATNTLLCWMHSLRMIKGVASLLRIKERTCDLAVVFPMRDVDHP